MSRKSVNDSSEHRVVPMMRYMIKNKKDLVKLLKMKGIVVNEEQIETKKVYFGSKKHGDNGEKSLRPSRDYLCELIKTLHENEKAKKVIRNAKDSDTKKKRLKLIEEDEAAREQASLYVEKNYPLDHKDYRVFEGNSYPDIFIETDDKVIVIEGKWTEQDVKEYTDYQKNRNQMVRHIHNAMNYVRTECECDKQVYGFYIVSEEFKGKWWEKKLSSKGFKKTIEHQFGLGDDEEKIENAYKGCITWEEIVKEFPEVKKETGWKC